MSFLKNKILVYIVASLVTILVGYIVVLKIQLISSKNDTLVLKDSINTYKETISKYNIKLDKVIEAENARLAQEVIDASINIDNIVDDAIYDLDDVLFTDLNETNTTVKIIPIEDKQIPTTRKNVRHRRISRQEYDKYRSDRNIDTLWRVYNKLK